MQTPVDDSGIFTEESRSAQASMTLVFLLRYREAHKLPPSPHWSPSQGISCKGQAPGRVTPWIAPGLPHEQVGLRCVFRQASPGPLPAVFTIKLPTELARALFPSVHGGGVGDIPPGTTRWYMGRTIRGGPACKIKACTSRLQVVLDIVIVPNWILYL